MHKNKGPVSLSSFVFAFQNCYTVILSRLYRKKNVLGNCQLSTVTLGINDIDLFPCHFCDIFYDILIAFTQESLSLQQKPKYICI